MPESREGMTDEPLSDAELRWFHEMANEVASQPVCRNYERSLAGAILRLLVERDALMSLLVREVVREDTGDGSTEWIASWPDGHDWFESWHDTKAEAIAKVAAHAGLAPAKGASDDA
jgi:hypothetical protein